MPILVLLTGFGKGKFAFARELEQSLAELGVKGEIKSVFLASSVSGYEKQVILTIPEAHQPEPEAFLQALHQRHPEANFVGLGVKMHQEEDNAEFPYLAVFL